MATKKTRPKLKVKPKTKRASIDKKVVSAVKKSLKAKPAKKPVVSTKKAIKKSIERVTELRKKPKAKAGVSPTGRTRVDEPVIQNIPVRIKERSEVREAFAPKRMPVKLTAHHDSTCPFIASDMSDMGLCTCKPGVDHDQYGYLAATIEAVRTYPYPAFGGKVLIPSLQQEHLFGWVLDHKGNVFVEAVAGSGKTTSLMHACLFMKGKIVVLAFNKKIAAELDHRATEMGMKGQLTTGTFHSMGFRTIRKVYPKVTVNDRNKRDHMLEVCQVPEKLHNFVATLVSLGKQSAVGILWDASEHDKWHEIIAHHALADTIEDPTQIEFALEKVRDCLEWSKNIGGKLMNFDDMIWLPLVLDLELEQYDWVLVDESQDTNPARRLLAKRMMKSTARAMFVGDRNQAIYGFTGADSDAVDILSQTFNCKALPLTVSYRCSKNVVIEAQKFVSHITSWDKSPDGVIRRLNKEQFITDEIKVLAPTDAILCRNTKPLVSLAFRLIRLNIGCHVEGRDIGQGLIKLAQRWKVRDLDQLRDKLETYVEHEFEKLMASKRETQAEALKDRVETLQILMDNCQTVDDLIRKIENLFKDTEDGNRRTVTLSTVHKAKGREWDRAYILGMNKYMPSSYAKQEWQMEQENNLCYVAVTRAKAELVYVEALEEK